MRSIVVSGIIAAILSTQAISATPAQPVGAFVKNVTYPINGAATSTFAELYRDGTPPSFDGLFTQAWDFNTTSYSQAVYDPDNVLLSTANFNISTYVNGIQTEYDDYHTTCNTYNTTNNASSMITQSNWIHGQPANIYIGMAYDVFGQINRNGVILNAFRSANNQTYAWVWPYTGDLAYV